MRKVLIIEDDVAVARALEEKLRYAGFDVGVMLWGETWLDFLISFHPDIILLDMLLPGHSGLEVLLAIRQNHSIRDVPVLVLSNFADEKIQEEAKKLGISGYLVKSETSLENVVLKIREVLKLN